jgi:glycosyltransferase involved in cell wall biosynthesis
MSTAPPSSASRPPRLRGLYICYLSLADPLVHTQVVAYLRGLAAAGHEIHLLTFETGRLTRAARRKWRRQLSQQGMKWHGLRYHKRPSLPATVYDALVGAAYAAFLVRRHRLDALHARGHVPAAMALITRWLCWPRPPALIFDIRGLMAEEYEDAGRWKRDSVPFRLAHLVQAAAIRQAAGIVVLTNRVRQQLFGSGEDPRVHVIPCCADLQGLASAAVVRERVRAELGLREAIVMVYVGKFTGWYMEREMVEFFADARENEPRMRFLILTQADQETIRQEFDKRGIETSAYTITSAPPEQIGSYLAAADFGLSFIRPSPSKASSSPTKVGEYLGAGLPVLSTAGVGDLDTLITPDVGVLVGEHSELAYRGAYSRVQQLLVDPATPGRCRDVAARELSLAGVGVPRYLELYEGVARLSAPYPRELR